MATSPNVTVLALTRDQVGDLIWALIEAPDPIGDDVDTARGYARVVVGIQQINDRAAELNAVLDVAERVLARTHALLAERAA